MTGYNREETDVNTWRLDGHMHTHTQEEGEMKDIEVMKDMMTD